MDDANQQESHTDPLSYLRDPVFHVLGIACGLVGIVLALLMQPWWGSWLDLPSAVAIVLVVAAAIGDRIGRALFRDCR